MSDYTKPSITSESYKITEKVSELKSPFSFKFSLSNSKPYFSFSEVIIDMGYYKDGLTTNTKCRVLDS